MFYGSATPPNRDPSRQLAFATRAEDRAVLKQRSMDMQARFESAPLHTLDDELADLRHIHVALYQGLCPAQPSAVGLYRGTPRSKFENAQRVVNIPNATEGMRQVDACTAPADVDDAMRRLHLGIQAVIAPTKGRDAAPYDAFDAPPFTVMADLTYQFIKTHPFLDGNGHTWRLALIGLGRHLGVTATKNWTVHARPHDLGWSKAIQSYPKQPQLLEAQCATFFEM